MQYKIPSEKASNLLYLVVVSWFLFSVFGFMAGSGITHVGDQKETNKVFQTKNRQIEALQVENARLNKNIIFLNGKIAALRTQNQKDLAKHIETAVKKSF